MPHQKPAKMEPLPPLREEPTATGVKADGGQPIVGDQLAQHNISATYAAKDMIASAAQSIDSGTNRIIETCGNAVDAMKEKMHDAKTAVFGQ
ncbi:unnamed protein product [Caenorhabditis auriculariae]|uniref:Uncharacterized protein n=1 Tax=Caenorhabditis auriculariae TaxID=2777116 RepID=A0A8S1HUV8_9PELO|nr:unnamed protein product [Caenorhabditis auriculariae]